jgi:spermidine synthase
MGSLMPSQTSRLAIVGSVVFLANAGMLVLQLVAGPLLSPFVGSSLETWTSIIAAFLIGIALGNAVGGRIADRTPTRGKLILFLGLGAVAALWMILLPTILHGGLYQSLPLKLRIPILAGALCLPVAFTLSLLTPLAIRIGIPDVASTGGVAGLIFALSTLGCLLGNYLTGFVLIPELAINTIALSVAGLLLLTAAAVAFLARVEAEPQGLPAAGLETNAPPGMSMAAGSALVFLCSFAGMTLELAASRLMALILGSSIYTWTGVIGVMLLGTACGNALGGRIADGARSPGRRETALGWTLLAAGFSGVMVIVSFSIISQAEAFASFGLRERILAVSFALFFPPMFCLGMVSPQVIRLCVTDVRHAGRTAGRIYAVSTLGAIVGTLACGYALISLLGIYKTILLAGLLPATALLLLTVRPGPERAVPSKARLLAAEHGVMLYGISTVFGAAFGGFILSGQMAIIGDTETVAETNYYTIRVQTPVDKLVIPPTDLLGALVGGPGIDTRHQKIEIKESRIRTLYLDHLTHSKVDLDDPTFFFYRHETIQSEVLRMQCQADPRAQNVLVIGGGGYTFPRYVRTAIPTANVDVVEIDPGVTATAYKHLGLLPEWGIQAHHMDGRQFVSEKSAKGHYDLVTLDAVNDLSVPSHLLTRECNEAVKATLKPNGIYLVTVIDFTADGLLWKAAFRTLRQSFKHVELMYPLSDLQKARESLAVDGKMPGEEEAFHQLDRSVLVLYAADQPLDKVKLKSAVAHQIDVASDTYVVPQAVVDGMLSKGKPVVLTDQYAPTDDLMRQVFRKR